MNLKCQRSNNKSRRWENEQTELREIGLHPLYWTIFRFDFVGSRTPLSITSLKVVTCKALKPIHKRKEKTAQAAAHSWVDFKDAGLAVDQFVVEAT